ncbi:MAG: hypothetical protein JSS49_12525 [Planctomycetes bacterium]|nr:hypothetical protein [Planctomycetota bacterium]
MFQPSEEHYGNEHASDRGHEFTDRAGVMHPGFSTPQVNQSAPAKPSDSDDDDSTPRHIPQVFLSNGLNGASKPIRLTKITAKLAGITIKDDLRDAFICRRISATVRTWSSSVCY